MLARLRAQQPQSLHTYGGIRAVPLRLPVGDRKIILSTTAGPSRTSFLPMHSQPSGRLAKLRRESAQARVRQRRGSSARPGPITVSRPGLCSKGRHFTAPLRPRHFRELRNRALPSRILT